MMHSKIFLKKIEYKFKVLLVKTGVHFWVELSLAHFHRFFGTADFRCLSFLAQTWRNDLFAIICVADGKGNDIIRILIQHSVGEVVIDKVKDRFSSYYASEKTFDILVEGDGSVVIVHSLWYAMAVGGEIIGEFPEKAFAW